MTTNKSIKAVEELAAWAIGIEGAALVVTLIAADCWAAAGLIGGACAAAVGFLAWVLCVE